MKYFLSLILCFNTLAINSYAGKDSSIIDSTTTLEVETTTSFSTKDISINSDYLEILEKTNNQLSLWLNPYGVLITALGVLFTILAIVVAIYIYRQSREHKQLIKDSLTNHKEALEALVLEKNTQLKGILDSYTKEIEAYRSISTKGKSLTTEEVFSEVMTKLEERIKVLKSSLHTYKHGGWKHKDINESIPINKNSIFNFNIELNNPNQSFVIYLKILTTENKNYWLGFGGNDESGVIEPYKFRNEYTTRTTYGSSVVNVSKNVIDLFKEGFPNTNETPIKIVGVRLRGSDSNKNEITFSYSIYDEELL